MTDHPRWGCPDGGRCHHECTVRCWRVLYAMPLMAAEYPGDRWPLEVRVAHTQSDEARAEHMAPHERSWPEHPTVPEPCPVVVATSSSVPAEQVLCEGLKGHAGVHVAAVPEHWVGLSAT